MEQLLQYIWKHKFFSQENLTTTDGRKVHVLETGVQNTNAGPDFLNARIEINGVLWAGNIEIHEMASAWYSHHHDKDKAYNNVILHVVGKANMDVATEEGNRIPQLVLSMPEHIVENYQTLLVEDRYPPCHRVVPHIQTLIVNNWIRALETERLNQKATHIAQNATRLNNDWEKTYFVALARSFGFGINGDTFEDWAETIPLNIAAHHQDDLFQIEALFLGQAGLLDDENTHEISLPEWTEHSVADLKKEYNYLRHKFSLTPIKPHLWKYLRLRPQNFPHLRILQLANLYVAEKTTLSRLIGCKTIAEMRNLLRPSPDETMHLSDESVNLLLINTALPMIFAYGKHKGKDTLCEKALDMLLLLKSEDNHIVRMWEEVGLKAHNAFESQALIQLKKEYCDRRRCLHCRIGYEYLKAKYIERTE